MCETQPGVDSLHSTWKNNSILIIVTHQVCAKCVFFFSGTSRTGDSRLFAPLDTDMILPVGGRHHRNWTNKWFLIFPVEFRTIISFLYSGHLIRISGGFFRELLDWAHLVPMTILNKSSQRLTDSPLIIQRLGRHFFFFSARAPGCFEQHPNPQHLGVTLQ